MLQKRTGPATVDRGARWQKQNLRQGSSAAQISHPLPATQAPSWSPPDLKPAKSSLRRVSVALRCEESNHYARVIARLNAHWRVIACAYDIQWILQARRGQGWRNRFYYRSREGLVFGAREYAGEIGGDALAVLLRLPRHFPEAVP